MNSAADLPHFQKLIQMSELPVPGLSWLDAQRADAANRFTRQGFPTRRMKTGATPVWNRC